MSLLFTTLAAPPNLFGLARTRCTEDGCHHYVYADTAAIYGWQISADAAFPIYRNLDDNPGGVTVAQVTDEVLVLHGDDETETRNIGEARWAMHQHRVHGGPEPTL